MLKVKHIIRELLKWDPELEITSADYDKDKTDDNHQALMLGINKLVDDSVNESREGLETGPTLRNCNAWIQVLPKDVTILDTKILINKPKYCGTTMTYEIEYLLPKGKDIDIIITDSPTYNYFNTVRTEIEHE